MAAPRTGKLPLELSSFVGREREIVEVQRLLAGARLLTLTGTGGCGKSRLALRVAANLAGRFEDGAWWVGLAPLANPGLTPKTVASALGVREQPGRSMVEALLDHLGSRNVLLVLDNCEHLIGACADLVEVLLLTCPNLKVLATSREALGVGGEVSWPVPSLSLPDADQSSIEELARYEAIRLFVERAATARPGFFPTEQSAPDLVRVCRELDGIPLAIELAAARTRMLTVGQIADRLGDSFGLLTGGGRTASPRQRTLRAAIGWSHELLSGGEQRLFRRLSVFRGGFTLEAAEQVCSGGGIAGGEVLELLALLVDKSLVVVGEQGGEARYRLLETVRQYGVERLHESAEVASVRGRHAAFFLALAEEAEAALTGPHQTAWLGRMESELDNLRAALAWFEEKGDAERGLRLASALVRFWWFRGHLAEGRARIETLLGPHAGMPGRDRTRARALHALGVLTYRHADEAAGDWDAARSYLEEALEIYRRLGEEARVADVLQDLGRVHAELGEWTAAHAVLGEGLKIGRRSGDGRVVASTLFVAGRVHWLRGEYSQARGLLEKSLGLYRGTDDSFFIAACHLFLGYIDCDEGDHAAARSRFLQMDEVAPLVRFPWGATYTLEGFARLAAARGQAARALRLGGATAALRQTYGVSIGPGSEAIFQRGLEPAWLALGEGEGKAVWEEGRSMTLEEALAYAMEGPEMRSDRPAWNPLSAREAEVLSLVAAGLTDVQVAERLHLSRRTVGHHLGSVYRKLAVQGRAAAVHKAGGLGLIRDP